MKSKVLLFVLVSLLLIGLTAQLHSGIDECDAETNKVVVDGIEYELHNNGEASLKKCKLKTTDLTLPDTILEHYKVTSIENGAFTSSKIKNLVLPECLEIIGRNAFYGCKTLETVKFNPNLKVVDRLSFYGTGLKAVELGENVTEIGESAFQKCMKLHRVVIPESMVTLGNHSFQDSPVKDLTIPISFNLAIKGNEKAFKHVTSIEKITMTPGTGKGFDYDEDTYSETPMKKCSGSLKTVVIMDGVESIGTYTFHGCKALTTLEISDSVKRIGDEAFCGCKKLKDFDMHANLTEIGRKAFKGCDGMEDFILPDGLSKIGNNAFGNLKSLKSLTLPDSLKEVASEAFKGCKNLNDIKIPSGLETIRKNAFENCASLKSLTLPDSVTEIGESSFKNCKKLENVVISESMKKIGKTAFEGTSLKDLTIPISLNANGHRFKGSFTDVSTIEKITMTPGTGKGFDYIGGPTLNLLSEKRSKTINNTPMHFSSKSLKTVIITDGVESIGDKTFIECEALTTVVFPDSLKKIGDEVFDGCKKLEDIKFPQSLTEIGKNAFRNCKGTVCLDLPDGLTKIGNSAFENWKSLVSLTIPNSVVSIGKASFKNCSKISKLTLPISLNSVAKLEDPAFHGCTKIKIVELTAGTGYGFDYDVSSNTPWNISSKSVKIIISDDVKSIGKNTFRYGGIKEITFGNGLETVNKWAFKGYTILDKDGHTKLSIEPKNLNGCTFTGKDWVLTKK